MQHRRSTLSLVFEYWCMVYSSTGSCIPISTYCCVTAVGKLSSKMESGLLVSDASRPLQAFHREASTWASLKP